MVGACCLQNRGDLYWLLVVFCCSLRAEFFWWLGWAWFVCVLGVDGVLVCVLGSVLVVLACVCMLFSVRFYVVWRVVWMLVVSWAGLGLKVGVLVLVFYG